MSYLTKNNYEGKQKAGHDGCFVPLLNAPASPGVKPFQLLVGRVVRNGPWHPHWGWLALGPDLSHHLNFVPVLLFQIAVCFSVGMLAHAKEENK